MGEPTRILCVDDEQNVPRSLTRLFLDDPYEILTATSGAEGLLILDQCGTVPIVISDYRMPGLTGLEFLQLLQQEGYDTPRSMRTGYATIENAVAAIKAGASDDITKTVRHARRERGGEKAGEPTHATTVQGQ